MPLVSDAIHNFLHARKTINNADRVDRWSIEFETQINVAAGLGEPVAGKKSTWSDGINTWHSIRIPKGASTDPTWNDYELSFPLDLHAEGIGMTGWRWTTRQSMWCAFDFDSLTSHAKGVGLDDAELARVRVAAEALPYIEARRSTGGGGVHLYCYLDGIPTQNHTEHAALARCILGMMSNDTGFDFANQIDSCGGVMWVWHRKMTVANQGLQILKPATKILSVTNLPANWHEHIEVVTRRRTKIRINEVAEDDLDPFEALAASRKMVPLDDSHKAQIEALMRSGFTTLWITDHHLLQTHTCALQRLTDELKLAGLFKTNSEGRDPGNPNCFMFPLPNGAWRVYRFSPGVTEAATWTQDGEGWTTCLFNKAPDLSSLCKALEGIEDPDQNGYVFRSVARVREVAKILGQEIKLDDQFDGREILLKAHKDGRLIIQIKREKGDVPLDDWLEKKNKWIRIFDVKTTPEEELDQSVYDHLIRALKTPAKEGAGFVLHEGGEWVRQTDGRIKLTLQGMDNDKTTCEEIMGVAIAKTWKLVCLPFQPEYPGGRQWNLDAPQFRFKPAELDDEVPHHPHWDMIFEHVGADLTPAIHESAVAAACNIKTGADYLKAWIACAFRDPFEPLPYLFLFGPENSGKSIFHEALAALVTKGVTSADRALSNNSDFNGELAGAIVCYVEEKDLSQSKHASARMKDWVTARTLSIRKMRTDAYSQPNTTHWIQCANKQSNCPVFPGDTRITVIYVEDLLPKQEVPKKEMMMHLEKEAPHFMHTLLTMELPPVHGRLRLPVIATANKTQSEDMTKDELERFIDEFCTKEIGAKLPFRDFYERFFSWIPAEEKHQWPRRTIQQRLPIGHLLVTGHAGLRYVSNLVFKGKA